MYLGELITIWEVDPEPEPFSEPLVVEEDEEPAEVEEARK